MWERCCVREIWRDESFCCLVVKIRPLPPNMSTSAANVVLGTTTASSSTHTHTPRPVDRPPGQTESMAGRFQMGRLGGYFLVQDHLHGDNITGHRRCHLGKPGDLRGRFVQFLTLKHCANAIVQIKRWIEKAKSPRTQNTHAHTNTRIRTQAHTQARSHKYLQRGQRGINEYGSGRMRMHAHTHTEIIL